MAKQHGLRMPLMSPQTFIVCKSQSNKQGFVHVSQDIKNRWCFLSQKLYVLIESLSFFYSTALGPYPHEWRKLDSSMVYRKPEYTSWISVGRVELALSSAGWTGKSRFLTSHTLMVLISNQVKFWSGSCLCRYCFYGCLLLTCKNWFYRQNSILADEMGPGKDDPVNYISVWIAGKKFVNFYLLIMVNTK